MESRIDYMKVSPDAFQAVWGLEKFVSQKAGICLTSAPMGQFRPI